MSAARRVVGIRGRLLFMGIVPALIAVSVLALSLGLYDRHRLATDLERKARLYGPLVAEQVASAIAFHDRETAREVFDSLRRDHDIVGLALYTQGGELLHRDGRLPATGAAPAVATTHIEVRDDQVVVLAPVVTREGPRGTLVIGMSMRRLQAARARTAAIAVIAALVAVAFAIAFAVPIATRASRRVQALASAASRVAAGDLDVDTLRAEPLDEIGVTMQAFNGMVATLRDLLTQQRQQAENERLRLETLVAERTGELERAQARLLQRQKLEAIGQLAAGIAHEINTPAQYASDNVAFLRGAFDQLLGAVEPCRRFLDGDDALRAEAQRALRAAKLDRLGPNVAGAFEDATEGLRRIATIVGAMKQFAHPSDGIKELVDLGEAIEATVTIASNEWKYVADLVTDLDPALPPVPCLRDELSQALLNCIVNAAHAIADADRRGDDERRITITTRRDGAWAEIRIRDTGTGIPEPVRHRIFDPFFTTKPVGKGTGQGLAITYGVVVERHGGQLAFETQTGVGTTFIIRLPLPVALATAA